MNNQKLLFITALPIRYPRPRAFCFVRVEHERLRTHGSHSKSVPCTHYYYDTALQHTPIPL